MTQWPGGDSGDLVLSPSSAETLTGRVHITSDTKEDQNSSKWINNLDWKQSLGEWCLGFFCGCSYFEENILIVCGPPFLSSAKHCQVSIENTISSLQPSRRHTVQWPQQNPSQTSWNLIKFSLPSPLFSLRRHQSHAKKWGVKTRIRSRCSESQHHIHRKCCKWFSKDKNTLVLSKYTMWLLNEMKRSDTVKRGGPNGFRRKKKA